MPEPDDEGQYMTPEASRWMEQNGVPFLDEHAADQFINVIEVIPDTAPPAVLACRRSMQTALRWHLTRERYKESRAGATD